jgi:YHS domain-containing protein
MKNFKLMAGIFLAALIATISFSVRADGTNSMGSVKPDLLTTCPVSGDKLGADMGKPVVIVYQGQEVKFCCPMCQADFDKDPAKYLKKIRAADAKPQN